MSLVRSIPSGELLHRGGEATLYKVEAPSGKRYTLKLYNSGNSYDRAVLESLGDAATGAAKNVAGIYRIAEYGTVGENAYILYDYIDGVCSRELSPMPLEFALHSLRQVVAALTALQKTGISHGDISTDNVFFDKSGAPVLIDFGIRGPGAPKFSAPERFDGQGPSEKSDLFSLGALFFFWLTGDTLFDGKNFDEIREAVKQADQVRPGEILFGKISAGLDIKPEALSLLEPIWKKTLATEPGNRADGLEELDELLEIALDSLGGQGVRLARASEAVVTEISGILEKNGTKTLEKVDFPFFEGGKGQKSPLKRWIFAAGVLIFLAIAAACVFFARSDSPSVDATGEALLQKSRSHEMEMQDSVKMPDLKNVLERLNPEENE